jgi:cysteinyl-tRNA synthetase
MPIHIYNSLSRKKEEFLPLRPPRVNIYTCGVTVYDDSHIGHARSLYIFDVMRRYLEYRGFQVKFVRNITDVDDKIINRANELKVGWKELVAKYIDSYYRDAQALGIRKGDREPRATENIPDMIAYIQILIGKGHAYEAGGDVYFNVRTFDGYGKLSGQSIDQMRSGSRIEPTEFKKDPLDFALWKRSKENEPSWPSPWGPGRPGWHIECSVMSQKFLETETLDIHAGGRDLIFPHHENEVAQAEALTGKPFAKYWIHHGLLTINGQKMSKSLGNFVTIKDFLARYKEADLLRLFFLGAHYSHPIDYNDEKISEADKTLEGIAVLLGRIDSLILPVEGRKFRELEKIKTNFIDAMDNDFNTPQGLAVIHHLVSLTHEEIDNPEFVLEAKKLLFELKDILGLEFKRKDVVVRVPAASIESDSLSPDIAELVRQRNAARKNGDFRAADRIRKELTEKGFIVEDAKDGTTSLRKKL